MLPFSLVQFPPENIRAPESDDTPAVEHEVGSACRIPSPTRVLFHHIKLPEPGYQHFFSLFKGALDELDQVFDHTSGLFLCQIGLDVESFSQVILRECHGTKVSRLVDVTARNQT